MARFPTDNFRRPAALTRFFLIMAVALGVDLYTKSIAFDRLAADVIRSADGTVHVIPAHTHQFIPGWLHFHVTANQGAVFGLGQGHRWFFIIVSLAAVGFLTYLFAVSGREWFYQILLGLLLAGVLGNMYDRIVHGYVRDMIYIFPGWRAPAAWWPAHELFPWIFNVADALLCVGVGLMLIYTLLHNPHSAPAANTPTESSRRERR